MGMMSTLFTAIRRQPAVIRYTLAIAVSGLVMALRGLVDPILGDRVLIGSGSMAVIFVACAVVWAQPCLRLH